jgi:hypothetical protein
MPTKAALIEALHQIIDSDEEDKTATDLAQHDRWSGYGRGVRDMANIARKALRINPKE